MTDAEEIYEICKARAEERGIWREEYKERLEKELGILSSKGFEDYFIILRDIVMWARSQGILVGPGRGSSAGSLVAYLLDITRVDPLKYDLYFERFLNPARPDLPDIDVDFQSSRRDEVFDYIFDKYGVEYACKIVTYSRFHIKQAIKDLCRIYKVPMSTVNKLSKAIPPTVRTYDEAMGILEVRTFLDNNPEIHRHIPELQGAIRQKSVHAAGVVITPEPISNYMSTERVSGVLCSCFDMSAVDSLGLLKIDILSLKTLDVVARALLLAGLGEEDLPADNTDTEFDDIEVYNIFKEGETLGVFQFESNLLTGLSKKLAIDKFNILYAATTIARPGPLHSGEAKNYIARHTGDAEVSYLDERMRPITEDTYGLMLFQEQTMKISMELANFTPIESEQLRKVIGKSKGLKAIDEFKNKFIEGAKDIDEREKIWDIIRESGAYSFPKAHAVSYSQVSYWCAWLKTYYLKEFLTALMVYEEDAMQMKAVRELRENGYEVLSPDINKSNENVHIADDGRIYMGIRDIEGVGDKACEEILSNRPYGSFDEFISKVQRRKVNAKVVRNLIQAGAFDTFNRRDILFFSFTDDDYSEWDEKEMIKRQNMVLDMPSKKPLIDFYPNKYEQHLEITPIKDIELDEIYEEVWVKGVISGLSLRKTDKSIITGTNKMSFFNLDDGTGLIECFVSPESMLLFERVFEDATPVIIKGHIFKSGRKLYVDGVINLEDEDKNLPTLIKYVYGRGGEIAKLSGSSMYSVVKRADYVLSKKSNPYARVYLDGDGTYYWFNMAKGAVPLCPGEIVRWTVSKEKFITILERKP